MLNGFKFSNERQVLSADFANSVLLEFDSRIAGIWSGFRGLSDLLQQKSLFKSSAIAAASTVSEVGGTIDTLIHYQLNGQIQTIAQSDSQAVAFMIP
ncbi:hypothetical protein [Coleofasciculus sp. FACHB-1120]|uniref:hypothetical protein n=1 Tax=Coleofasciculus sp. FACHB-1120 TaxID=2692783 RepID=UPI0016874986|nr:hypothetical protein [Coleofasciculus sp. FACHB-1120]MBD2741738.1 hypothetical protein [Coleofasciculus sp. FACHB-1120]